MPEMTLVDMAMRKQVEYKERVKIFLINGIKMEGTINNFDSECIQINNDQFIFRNAISTIQPSETSHAKYEK